MISGAIEASRSWGAGLNRLGWGCLCALSLCWSLGLDYFVLSQSTSGLSTNGTFLIYAVALLLASALLGSMAITLGSLADRKRYTIERRTLLAERIGAEDNVLLIQLFGEATLKYEMAAGVRGTIIIGGISILLKWLSVGLPPALSFSVGLPSLAAISGIFLTVLFDWLLNKTALENFDALEKAVVRSEERKSGEPTDAALSLISLDPT